MKVKGQMKQICSTLLSMTLWSFGTAVLAGLALHWWYGDQVILGRYTAYFMPCLLVVLLPSAAWALLSRQWVLSAVFCLSLGVILSTYAPLFFPRSHAVSDSLGEMKVMSFNVWSRNPTPHRILDAVAAHRPDIMLLQEITPSQFQDLSKGLEELAGVTGENWQTLYEPGLLQAVISRYRLARLWSAPEKGKAQVVTAESPFGTVMVFNVHPRWGNWVRRHRQLADLLYKDIVTCRFPLILGGDFNATERSEISRLLATHLRSAHWDAGKGFGFSFPAAIRMKNTGFSFFPFLRIDHIYFSKQFVAVEAATISDAYGSDHFPVIARLKYSKQA